MLRLFSLVACLLLLFLAIAPSCELLCDDASACRNGDLAKLLDSSDTYLECNGYRSCESSLSKTMHNITCNGALSCYNSSEKISSNTTMNHLCNGLYSCASWTISNINDTYDKGQRFMRPINDAQVSWHIECSGERSCQNARVDLISNLSDWSHNSETSQRTFETADNTFICSGDQSCSYSSITLIGNNTVYATGHMAAFGTEFVGTEDTSESWAGVQVFHFEGTRSARKADIKCGIAQTCIIYCYDFGCDDSTKVSCAGNDPQNCNITGDCVWQSGPNNTGSYSCAPREMSSYLYSMPSLESINVSEWGSVQAMYSAAAAASNGSYACEDAWECAGTSEISVGPIACSGYEACSNVTSLAISRTGAEWSGRTGMRCDGAQSCLDALYVVGDDASDGRVESADVYLAGKNAARQQLQPRALGVMATTLNEDIESFVYDLFCTGSGSCAELGRIRNAKNLYCLASEACLGVAEVGNVENVWSYGVQAMREAKISSVSRDLCCSGYEACLGAEVLDVGGNVFAYGKQAMTSATIEKTNSLLGYGWGALNGTKVVDSNNLFCDGEFSCAYMEVERVHTIRANGSNVLSGAKIVSLFTLEGVNDGDKSLTLFVEDDSDPLIVPEAAISVTCLEGDSCSIICSSILICCTSDDVADGLCDDVTLVLTCETGASCDVTAPTVENDDDEGSGSGDSGIDWIYFVLGAICVVVLVITVLSVLHSKQVLVIEKLGCKLADGTKIVLLWVYALQLYDIFSDIYFAYSVIRLTIEQEGENSVILVIAVLSTLFVILPYAANVHAALTLQKKIYMNHVAQVYFQAKQKLFCCLVILSGGVYPSLQLTCSRLFGLAALDSGLNQTDLAHLRKIQVTHSCLGENVPQLILQLFYIVQRSAVDDVVILALVSSFFSIFVVVFSYFFSKQLELRHVSLKLSVSFDGSAGSSWKSVEKDDEQFEKHMGLRDALTDKVAAELGILRNKMEIYAIVGSHHGCIVYVSYGLNGTGKTFDLHQNESNRASVGRRGKPKYVQGTREEIETEDMVLELFTNGCKSPRFLIPNSMKQVWELAIVPKVTIEGLEQEMFETDGGVGGSVAGAGLEWMKKYNQLLSKLYQPELEIEIVPHADFGSVPPRRSMSNGLFQRHVSTKI